MALQYSPKIVQDSLVMCLDASNNKSYPTDLPLKDQLNLWLDAADDTTFSYSSGTTVSQWRDKSGRNNHAIVMAGSPLRSVAINSRKAVSFTSTTAFKCVTGLFSSTATHIVVCRATTSSATYQRVYHGGANSDYYVFIGALQNSIATFWGSGPSTWFDVNANSPFTTILNTLRIISAVNNGSTATPYYDGIAMSTKATTNSAAYTGYELNTYSNGAPYQPLIGEVCEIIVFNKQLSLTELKQVHTYLGQKWGISNTDRSIVDLAGNDDNGLLGNGSTSNMPLYDYYNKGSFKFFASNKYIKLGISTVVNQFAGDFTVSLWAMATAENSNYGNLIGDYYTTGGVTTAEWQIMMNNSSAFLNVYRVGTGFIINNISSGFSANTWINVVLTRIGSAITLYANNNVIGTATNSLVFGSATGNVNIGINGNNSAEPFSGLISNVLIYRKGLSAVEVAQNYEAQKSKFANTIVQQGLVLNLDAGNVYSYAGAGTTFYDVSGNSNNGTLTNGPTYSSDVGGAIVFDGTDDYVNVANASSLNPSNGISVSVWVKFTSTINNTRQMLVEKHTSPGFGWWFAGQNNKIVWLIVGTSGGEKYIDLTNNTSIISGIIYNIVGTYDVTGSTLKLYVNGSDDGGTIIGGGSGLSSSSNPLIIGKQHNWGNSPSSITIFNTLLYNRALSATEVLQNYNATKGRFGL